MGLYQSKPVPTFDIPVFCINLPSSTERRARMEQRFASAGIDNVTFVSATSHESGLVDYYAKGATSWYPNPTQWRKDLACFASHLLAIRLFLAQDSSHGLICEDDILFRNGFREHFNVLMENLPDGAPLLSLSYMATTPFDTTPINSECESTQDRSCVPQGQSAEAPSHSGIDGIRWITEEPGDLWKYPPENVWGAQCYLISREYAQQVLDTFDRPIRELSKYGNLTSEIILQRSNGYLSAIPLAIEDCIDSVRKPLDIPYHLKHFCYWDWENFSESDPDQESPVSLLKPNRAWFTYPCLFGEITVEQMKKKYADYTGEHLRDEIAELTKLLK